MAGKNSHDQNFKNLILDYPRQALAFFAAAEAEDIDDTVRITPLRQEQLKDRLGDRFRELDVPLLVEWPDGRREALLFVLEEESDPVRFSIHRLVHYCADLAELYQTDRVVPVVIFLRGHPRIPERLQLGSERHCYLDFRYLKCELGTTDWLVYQDSNNLVARLNLPNMSWSRRDKVEVYASAIRGLLVLEPNPDKQLKYIDFIDIYTALDDNEMHLYRERYPQEEKIMATLTERLLDEGLRKGIQQGMQQGLTEGRADTLRRLLTLKFGELPEIFGERLSCAGEAELTLWIERVLFAASLDEVFDLEGH